MTWKLWLPIPICLHGPVVKQGILAAWVHVSVIISWTMKKTWASVHASDRMDAWLAATEIVSLSSSKHLHCWKLLWRDTLNLHLYSKWLFGGFPDVRDSSDRTRLLFTFILKQLYMKSCLGENDIEEVLVIFLNSNKHVSLHDQYVCVAPRQVSNLLQREVVL